MPNRRSETLSLLFLSYLSIIRTNPPNPGQNKLLNELGIG
jgi:hypothetical protein